MEEMGGTKDVILEQMRRTPLRRMLPPLAPRATVVKVEIAAQQ